MRVASIAVLAVVAHLLPVVRAALCPHSSELKGSFDPECECNDGDFKVETICSKWNFQCFHCHTGDPDDKGTHYFLRPRGTARAHQIKTDIHA